VANDFDVAVAGGGIAGLTAGLTSARLGRKTLVLAGDVIGGQLLSIERIEGYPGFPEGVPGYELCPMAQEQAIAAGAEFAATALDRIEPRDGGWALTTGDGEFFARAAVLATGSALRELGVPGERRLRGKGVSHCASCDAPLLRGRAAAVVGAGDSAMQEALTLAGSLSKVTILHRGDRLSGQASYRERVLKQANIEVRFNTVVEEIVGATTVTGVRTRDARTGASADIEVGAVFVYVGLQPNTEFLNGAVDLDPGGLVPADALMRTALAGVCAAGSVRRGWGGRAVITAADGATAAVALDRYLTDGAWRDL
jgi:thioredoxin reductase (NADPH)